MPDEVNQMFGNQTQANSVVQLTSIGFSNQTYSNSPKSLSVEHK